VNSDSLYFSQYFFLQGVTRALEILGDRYTRYLDPISMTALYNDICGDHPGPGILMNSFVHVIVFVDFHLFSGLQYRVCHIAEKLLHELARNNILNLFRISSLRTKAVYSLLPGAFILGIILRNQYCTGGTILLATCSWLSDLSRAVVLDHIGANFEAWDDINKTIVASPLSSGDLITEINNIEVSRLSVDKLRLELGNGIGEEEDIVKLRVVSRRYNRNLPPKSRLLFAKLHLEPKSSISSHKTARNCTYIHIQKFTDRTCDEIQEVLKFSKKDQHREGIIIDLRGNPGGSFGSAIETAALFLEAGRVLTTIERPSSWAPSTWDRLVKLVYPNREDIESHRSLNAKADIYSPLLLLTDYLTASSSEVLAWALSDNNRAEIWGQKTFGKDVAQVIFPQFCFEFFFQSYFSRNFTGCYSAERR
jgi:hypothetical protein